MSTWPLVLVFHIFLLTVFRQISRGTGNSRRMKPQPDFDWMVFCDLGPLFRYCISYWTQLHRHYWHYNGHFLSNDQQWYSYKFKGLPRSMTNALWYSCHVFCSSFLTETQWIYRNFIGRETKPGCILILRQVITNKKYQWCVNYFSL